MAVNPISNAVASYVKTVVPSGNVQGGVVSGAVSAMQEATETAETTRKEAMHGDRVAIQKLARQQQQHQQTAPAQEPGKGEAIDKTA